MTETNFAIAGGVSGAITDPNSKEALKHAEMYYEQIRHMTTDIEKIAENTGYTKAQILLIKNYLFMDSHELFDGFRRFDSCFEIAESWRRLAFDKKNIQKHDLTLLNHELKEIQLVTQGFPQDIAHEKASESYNYSAEYKKFYEKLGIKQNKHSQPINAGAIMKKKDNSYEYSRW